MALDRIKVDTDWQGAVESINKNFTELTDGVKAARDNTNVMIPLIASVTEAVKKVENKYIGQMIFIGTGFPAELHLWDGITYNPTGRFYNGDLTVPLSNYYTKEEIDGKYVKVKTTNKVIL